MQARTCRVPAVAGPSTSQAKVKQSRVKNPLPTIDRYEHQPSTKAGQFDDAVARGCPLHKPDATRRLAGALRTARHAADAGHARATIRDAWGIVSWGHEFRDGTNDHARDGLFTSPRRPADATASAYDPRLHVPAASPSKQLCLCYLPPHPQAPAMEQFPPPIGAYMAPLRPSAHPLPAQAVYPAPHSSPHFSAVPRALAVAPPANPSPAMKVHPDGMSAYLDYGIPVPEDEEASENASPPEQPMTELKELEVVMAELDGEAMKALATEIYRMLTEGQEVASGVE
ncbi:hypothetical protein NLJ89_g6647 [Agrocybe chaxingu]|uniref:Uncharacterized protein n=1 Tax=Agrocybe chaxingu TaxID=84603 RepID=A0A9W8K0F7_9AGAR|nr:hypothetical protein NLJ89_g6647 [Agrocybe chaxingu]